MLENRLKDLDRVESKLIDHYSSNMPYQFILSRFEILRYQRILLTENISLASSKARISGLQLKRIEKLLSRIEK